MIEPVESHEEVVLKPAIEMVENWYEELRDCTPADDLQINRIAPKRRKLSVNLVGLRFRPVCDWPSRNQRGVPVLTARKLVTENDSHVGCAAINGGAKIDHRAAMRSPLRAAQN